MKLTDYLFSRASRWTLLNTESKEIANLRLSVIISLGCLVLASGLVWRLGWPLPVMGWVSGATIMSACYAIAGMAGFYAGYRFNTNLLHRTTKPWRRAIHSFSLSVAYAIFYGLLGLLVGLFIDNAFKGISLDGLTIIGLSLMGAAMSSYTALQWGNNLTTVNVSQTMVGFLVIGVCSSMVLNQDPEWWRRNFSYLGDIHGNTFILFGFTLIVSGLLLLTIADYIAHDLQIIGQTHSLFAQRARWVQRAMVGIALCMVLLGLFPNVVGEMLGLLHNMAAKALVGIYMGLIILISWLLPGVSRTFYGISYAFGLTIALLYIVAYGWFGYLNLTSFELLSFFICIAWLYLLLQLISAKTLDASRTGLDKV